MQDPEAWLEGMNERTFQKWQQYFAEEPFGPGVLNLMLARVAAAACHGGVSETDMMPTVE